MRSLNAHLTAPGDHGHLPFHAGCAVCRATRLAGALPSRPVVSQRTQASLVAALLALSAGAPASAIAAPETPAGEGSDSPQGDDGFGGKDPGDELPLPNEIPLPAPLAGGDDDSDGSALEGEPQEQLSAPPPSPAPAAPAPTAGAIPAPPSAPVAPTAEAPAPVSQPTERSANPKKQKRSRAHKRAPVQRQAPSAPAGPQGSVVGDTSSPVGPVSSAASGGPSSTAGHPAKAAAISESAESYLVRPGDSLWSIAKRLLGPEASTAQVAREVHRLWTLNAERIGTGDPDLIMVGQTLRLR